MNCALAYELFAESIYMSRNLATIGACAIILLGSAAVSANAKAGGAGGASFGGHAGSANGHAGSPTVTPAAPVAIPITPAAMEAPSVSPMANPPPAGRLLASRGFVPVVHSSCVIPLA